MAIAARSEIRLGHRHPQIEGSPSGEPPENLVASEGLELGNFSRRRSAILARRGIAPYHHPYH
jgi:hypothetical protein